MRISSPDIVRVKKSKRMKWTEHNAHIGEMRNAYEILVGKSGRKRATFLETYDYMKR
jgi:hypothetical protein